MRRFILSLGSMAVLFGTMSSPLLAAHGSGHGSGHSSGHGAVQHAVRHVDNHGVAHSGIHGVAGFHGLHHGYGGYLAHDYHGWGRFYWNARYRCNWYFCPQASCYYYWYAPGECYLPDSQVNMFPPTADINNNANGAPVLPMPPPQ